MAYIKLEDVQKILDKYTFYSWILRDEINSLPSIDFEEMIQQVQNEYWIWNKKIDVLQELLNKLQ